MIDIQQEHLMTLKEAAKTVPGRPHLSTVHRWAHRPNNALDTVKVGGRVFTSVQAIERFIQSCTAPAKPAPRPSARRQRQIERAERELAEAGL